MRILSALVVTFIAHSAMATNYLCMISRGGGVEASFSIPVFLRPNTSAVFMMGQNIFQHRLYFYRGKVDVAKIVSEKTANRPRYYENGQFAAVARTDEDNALNMYIGSIRNASDISAGFKYRKFDEKGPHEDAYSDQELSINCESRR